MKWLDLASADMGESIEGQTRRRRTPSRPIAKWLIAYRAGLSLLEASRSQIDGLHRSHNSIWRWIQRFSGTLTGKPFTHRPKAIVLDETAVNLGGEEFCLCGAIDPERRRILHVRMYGTRSILTTTLFLRGLIKRFGRLKVVYTDGGVWYPCALRMLRLKHMVLVGGVRNYIERWFLTLKHRTRRFDNYFPCRCGEGLFTHVQNWLNLFTYYYNHLRPHMTLVYKQTRVLTHTQRPLLQKQFVS